MKILFTALTLGAGFRGGEIVPVLFTGAAFEPRWGRCWAFPTALVGRLAWPRCSAGPPTVP